MKKARADRDNVIGNKNPITVAVSKNYKDIVEAKAKEMGVSMSCFARMAINEFMKNH